MNTAISDRSASPWIVLKFGGTSVSSKARWEAIAEQARKRKSEGLKTLIVVSAVSGVTNALQSAADPASAPDLPALTLAGLVDRHRALASELGLDSDAVLGMRLTELRSLVDEAGQGTRDLAWQARWLAQGELLSSTLGAAYLAREVPGCRWLDSRQYLRARETPNQSERGRWLSVACDPAHDAALAVRLAGEGDVFITQGFMAGDDSGATRILGRGGSDTSAACFGALLGARCVEIWTDVPGMFSANPRQVPDARLLRRLDFEEAQEIATTGAKVLHPRCIDPCRRAQVPMAIRWTERPDSERTEIGFEAVAARSSIKAISLRAGTTLIAMESIGMWQQVGFLADVFAEFKRHGLSVDLIGSSETNVTVSLDATENLLDAETVEALARDLARVCRVKVIAPCAVITLVGRGMRAMLHRLVQTLGELGQTKVHLISQSSNDLNLSIVVDEAAGESLVPLLHQTLEHSGVMATDDARLFGPSWRDLHASPGSVAPPRWWRQRVPELSTLAAQGTPRYVYALGEVRAAAAALRALRGVDRWYYACKANEHPALLRTLVQAGFGLECVSIGEIEHALASVPGLLAPSLLFTPNFAARSEYAAALALGVRLTVDNLHPLREWPELWKGREIMLRVDPGIGRGHHDKVRTGGARSKFGIGVADLSMAIELAKSAGAEVIGLHAHAGSGIEQAGHWAQLLAELASLAERHGAIRILDLGGGMGVHGGLDLAAMDAAIGHARALYPQFEIWMEPGRWPVAQAGVLLATVTQLKEKEGVRFLGIDAGMHTLIRPALYDARHPVHNLSRLSEPTAAPVQVVGPICESGDVIAADCVLPASREGDLILIDEAGAYGAVMASNYNRRPKPQESVLDE